MLPAPGSLDRGHRNQKWPHPQHPAPVCGYALSRGRRAKAPKSKRRCATGAGAASSASAAASRSSSSPRNWRTSWRAEGCGCVRAAGVGVAFLLPAIALVYEELAQTASNAPKGCPVLLLQRMRAAPRRCLAQMSAPPPRPWNFARLQERPRYASWPSFGSARRKPVQFFEISSSADR